MTNSRDLSKKAIVRIVSFSIAAVVVFSGFIYSGYSLAASYKMRMENGYSAALTDLTNYLNNVTYTLEKEMYAGTPTQMATLSAQLWKEAGAAKSCLSQLPVSNEQTDTIYKFLSQVGDYSLALSRKVSTGATLTDAERKSLEQLNGYAVKLTNEVSDMQAMMSEGNMWAGEVAHIMETADKSGLSELNTAVKNITATVTDYPTLVYDGPFSDHINQKTPELTKNKTSFSREDAKKAAAKYLECSVSEIAGSSEENGALPCYVFNNGSDTVAVSKQGGYCVYVEKNRNVQTVKLSKEAAVNKAAAYLSKIYDAKFEKSYYMINENICVVNFAYLMDDIICYSDLIKVGVSLETGEIVSVEARGYVMNHRERKKPSAKYTEKDARKVLSPLLTVSSSNRAIINTGGLNEVYCYEFVCKGKNNQDILVYVNANTLQEENILVLLKSDGGTMTR